MIWRGTATATVSAKPAKNEARLQKAMKKLDKRWQKMVRKGL